METVKEEEEEAEDGAGGEELEEGESKSRRGRPLSVVEADKVRQMVVKAQELWNNFGIASILALQPTIPRPGTQASFRFRMTPSAGMGTPNLSVNCEIENAERACDRSLNLFKQQVHSASASGEVIAALEEKEKELEQLKVAKAAQEAELAELRAQLKKQAENQTG